MSDSASAHVLLAAGAEEMEVVIIVDVLRRAGVDVTLLGVDGPAPVACSRRVVIKPDAPLSSFEDTLADAVILPGGLEGAQRLAASPAVGALLNRYAQASRWIAAICAAPLALLEHEIELGSKLTCHPSVVERLAPHYVLSSEAVVADSRLLTSRGPGSAFEFSLALVGQLRGLQVATAIRTPLMLPAS